MLTAVNTFFILDKISESLRFIQAEEKDDNGWLGVCFSVILKDPFHRTVTIQMSVNSPAFFTTFSCSTKCVLKHGFGNQTLVMSQRAWILLPG